MGGAFRGGGERYVWGASFFFLSLKIHLRPPFQAPRCGPAGEGDVADERQCAQQRERERGRERLTFKGQEDSAGRKRQIQ